MTVYVLPKWETPIGRAVDVTIGGTEPCRQLSPMLLDAGFVDDGRRCHNVENAWQYSKVYPEHYTPEGPTPEWYDWRNAGFSKQWADRYPMGKGAKPKFSWWDGSYYGYVPARKKIYVPLYRESAEYEHPLLLEDLWALSQEGDLTIQDYDAYNHISLGMTLGDVLNNPAKKMGHGFVLAMMIEEYLD